MEQYPSSMEEQREKARTNRAMFDAIARRYDLLNRLISLGLDARWRARIVDLCALPDGARCLDLCCGTGDVTRALARRGAQAIGLDASAEMLAVARARSGHGITFVQGDALQLPFPDDTFDAVTIAFGNRNVASLEQLYAEMRRVARPHGRVVSLEINRPVSPLIAWGFFLYFSHLPPLLARLVGVDPAAYRYLSASVRSYPTAQAVADIMRQAGLRDIRVESHLAGAIVLHQGIA